MLCLSGETHRRYEKANGDGLSSTSHDDSKVLVKESGKLKVKVDVDVAVYGFMPSVTPRYRVARAVKGVRYSGRPERRSVLPRCCELEGCALTFAQGCDKSGTSSVWLANIPFKGESI